MTVNFAFSDGEGVFATLRQRYLFVPLKGAANALILMLDQENHTFANEYISLKGE